MQRIVVIEDEHAIANAVTVRLRGEGYEVVYNDEAANADRLDSLVARDLNGELGAEIVLVHSLGEFGNSLTVWGARGDSYRPQPARGGCWDGSNTYGITGAVIEDGSITATCDGSLLPRAAWPSDVYVWVDGRWTYQRTQAAQP